MKEIIITSSVLILCIVLIRKIFKGKISSRMQYALWFFVALRLMIPASAQIYMTLGNVTEFRVMDVIGSAERRVADLSEQLREPIAFGANEDAVMPAGYADGDGVFFAGSPGVSRLDIFRKLWLGGMLVMAFWMVTANLVFMVRLRRNRQEFILPEKTEQLLKEKLPERAGSRLGAIKKYTVECLDSPCLYGLPGREAVYLTPEVIKDEDKLCHVLTHEYCHKKHGDSFWSFLRVTLVTVYWFHPLVWIAALLSKRDCELACDEAALGLLGEEERISYGETLLSIITCKGKLSDFACTATTMTGSVKSVKERIRFIAKKPQKAAVAMAVALALVVAVLVLVFTKSPRFFGGTWSEGTLAVTLSDMQIVLPESIAQISGVASEKDGDDLVIYQVASGQEAGRFCKVLFAEALRMVDEGREVTPLGDYGQNTALKQYMGILPPGEEIQHTYTPVEKSVTTHDYTPVEGIPESGGVPGTDSGNGAEKIPSPEESDHALVELPYEEDQPMEAQELAEEQKKKEEQKLEEKAGQSDGQIVADSNVEYEDTTYLIEDQVLPRSEMEESYDYLPNEQITVTVTPEVNKNCYIYVKADYSHIKDKYLEEMEFINSELKNVTVEVIVTSAND